MGNGNTQRISTASGVVLQVSVNASDGGFDLAIAQESGRECILHWGLLRAAGAQWRVPPRVAWPAGSVPAERAVRTPLAPSPETAGINLRLEPAWQFQFLEFVLFDPRNRRWDNNHGHNYRVALPPPTATRTAAAAVREMVRAATLTHEHVHSLDEGYELAVAVRSSEDTIEVALATDLQGPVVLHWGVAFSRHEWMLPPADLRPPETREVDERAVQTPFADQGELRSLKLVLPNEDLPRTICFVLLQPDQDRWWNNRGRNFYIPLQTTVARGPLQDPALVEIAEEIIERETGASSWTLMHRFDLAWALIDRIPSESADGLALIFVWLRFSAIRQLDWQRSYNTKPRELAHAQDRLSSKLADRAAQADSGRSLWRMIATCLGRGGDGQRVRDAILEIMHRHHIKETTGHFLEEWHQKLHNNTTPDDVVICEAYLEFLRRYGDRDAFCAALEAGGVSRERLASYERPIRSEPDFIPHLRDPLLHDFGEFLGALRAVHSATDLSTALHAARPFLGDGQRQLLDTVWHRRNDSQARSWLLESITKIREQLAAELRPGRAGLRDLFYLDLALEDFLRGLVERNLQERLSPDELLSWMEMALRNLCCARKNLELSLSLRHLQRLAQTPRNQREWALQAQSVLERIRRELVTITDGDGRLLQPVAEYLGEAFGAPRWAVKLFSEEVVRGRLEFVVSVLAHKLEDVLRPIAGVGKWQLASRGRGSPVGEVRTVASLAETNSPDRATILVVEQISGEEEVPPGVVAVITGATINLMAHVAVRARNAGVLLATCWDPGLLDNLRSRTGSWIRLVVHADGELALESSSRQAHEHALAARVTKPLLRPPPSREYAIGEDGFDVTTVGGKSRNLKRLRGRLPDWIRIPAGVALPYGTCEHILEDPVNAAARERLQTLERELSHSPTGEAPAHLTALRDVIASLSPSPELERSLRRVISDAHMSWPEPWHDAWQCITRVWASKWNERAFRSRRAAGIHDEDLIMAVLIQEVVSADYAFVAHTANPVTGDRDELCAEIVPGLGETLVGNHPGRALGIVHRRGEKDYRITSYPSKSLGLFGHGWMFRSDSNGEDLVSYAGAGLYDSVMFPRARPVSLSYADDELLWNAGLRRQVLMGIAEIGRAVEAALGGPQDIEGAYAQGRFFILQARPQVGLDHG